MTQRSSSQSSAGLLFFSVFILAVTFSPSFLQCTSSQQTSPPWDPTLVFTANFSLNWNPNVAPPQDFASKILIDFSKGFNVSATRIQLLSYGSPASSSGPASVGFLVSVSCYPSSSNVTSSELTSSQVFLYAQSQMSAKTGPLLNGTYTRDLNPNYFVVITTGQGPFNPSSSSTGGSGNAASAGACITFQQMLAFLSLGLMSLWMSKRL